MVGLHLLPRITGAAPSSQLTYMQSLSLVSEDETGEWLGCICCQEEQELLPPLN